MVVQPSRRRLWLVSQQHSPLPTSQLHRAALALRQWWPVAALQTLARRDRQLPAWSAWVPMQARMLSMAMAPVLSTHSLPQTPIPYALQPAAQARQHRSLSAAIPAAPHRSAAAAPAVVPVAAARPTTTPPRH
ncbi:hypothetical protein FHY31_002731 [Xanthomonas euvesicatoria]|uniref:Uncharacterized protein n=1 Tax=Xanthomonas euvesicatoria TaxID=456327 RepID=A0AAW3U5Q6_XANEU|nr:hypothetical protein [Xanthomonas euvesicatoria]MBB4870961.1 hypothetical protein [Xanthomonas euvesicatoria]